MKINKVHNMDFLTNDLPDGCAKLIIADPPYFNVRGAFDFIWSDKTSYLKDVLKWAHECQRLLAPNGTLFWYGSAKNIAYTQVLLDELFNLANNLVWNKGSFMALEHSTLLRTFPPCTERILMYTKDEENTRHSVINIREYLRAEILKSKGRINYKEINEMLGTSTTGGGTANAFLSLTKIQPSMITESNYLKLQSWCAPYLATNYADLLTEYNEMRRYFKNAFQLQEVLDFSNEQNTTGEKYDHETVKPEKLTRSLILSCSQRGDLVVVPFAGSGTECAMSAKEGRDFIGYDVNKKHVATATKRCGPYLSQTQIF